MGELSPWHLLIVAVVLMALFGAKRLPGAAKAVGQSMKIFKDETKGLRNTTGDEHPAPTAAQLTSPAVPAPAVAAPQVAVPPVSAAPVSVAPVSVDVPGAAAAQPVPATPPSA